MSRTRPLLQWFTLGTLALYGMAAAQVAVPGFLPPDYFSRFSTTELAAAGGTTGFGVRYFPLPFKTDLRATLVKHPGYWEYGLTTRQNDTSYSAGVFSNGDAVWDTGISRLEARHDPWKGLQYTGLLQWVGPASQWTGDYRLKNSAGTADIYPISKFTVGYAFTTLHDRVRVLNNAGVGLEEFFNPYPNGSYIAAPFTQTEVYGNHSWPLGSRVNVGLSGTARLFTFPTYSRYQASIDINPSVEIRPFKGLTLNATHLERFARQNEAVPLNDLNYGRYRETNASVSYRIDNKNDFSVNMLRTRFKADWTDKQYFLYNDVLFRINALPVLIGPTVGYQWYPATAKNTRWIFSLAFAPK